MFLFEVRGLGSRTNVRLVRIVCGQHEPNTVRPVCLSMDRIQVLTRLLTIRFEYQCAPVDDVWHNKVDPVFWVLVFFQWYCRLCGSWAPRQVFWVHLRSYKRKPLMKWCERTSLLFKHLLQHLPVTCHDVTSVRLSVCAGAKMSWKSTVKYFSLHCYCYFA